MNAISFNRKSLLFSILLATTFGLNAQIKSTHTDEKYNYTTVVYKDTAATDKAVLAALESSVGMGDVIRITVAPPKPAVVPTIDKSKGEDTWLKSTKPATEILLTASASPMPINMVSTPINNLAPKTATASVKVVPVAVSKTAPLAANPMVKKMVAAPNPVVVPAQNEAVEKIAPAPRTIKTTSSVSSKTGKSSKKFAKKSGGSSKMKARKKGKQRYSCPKF